MRPRTPVMITKGKLDMQSRFVVASKLYNPLVWTGEKLVPLAAAIGLTLFGFDAVFGIDIRAHNISGLVAACAWLAGEGCDAVAGRDFTDYHAPATLPEHTIPESPKDSSLEGKVVKIHGSDTSWLVVKQQEQSLKLQGVEKPTQTIWRTVENIQPFPD